MDAEKEVSFKEGRKFARLHGAMYFETSSREGTNIAEVFLTVANQMFQIHDTVGFLECGGDCSGQRSSKIKLDEKKKRRKKNKRKGGCC